MDSTEELLINIKKASARCPKELASILEIEEEVLITATDALAGPTVDDLKEKLVQAMLFNAKLLDEALGPDGAMHQLIDENLAFVIKNMN
ncbi:MAG: hypothetical protein HRT38_03930 [Alteromonadaceae bacterium]|nr:hypothetical protein [Alteromonadaceae bacterium]